VIRLVGLRDWPSGKEPRFPRLSSAATWQKTEGRFPAPWMKASHVDDGQGVSIQARGE